MRCRLLCLVLASFALLPHGGFAQDADTNSPLEVRNAVGTILIAGLVGGILGLSTLSFYDKPQDNIRNIFFGAGAGMIVSTLWMTMSVATTPIEKTTAWAPYVDLHHSGFVLSARF